MRAGSLVLTVLALGATIAECRGADGRAAVAAVLASAASPAVASASAKGATGRESGTGALVRVTADVEHGAYLTDGNGRALYRFEADTRGHSVCDGDCALAWPPYVTRGIPTAESPAVGSSLLSTMRRRDGRVQVTYGGWPLYYDELDTGPGRTEGHDVEEYGAKWYLVAPRRARSDGQGRTRAAEGRGRSLGDGKTTRARGVSQRMPPPPA